MDVRELIETLEEALADARSESETRSRILNRNVQNALSVFDPSKPESGNAVLKALTARKEPDKEFIADVSVLLTDALRALELSDTKP